MKTIIRCVDCFKEIIGKVYVDGGKFRCEKCVEKLYKLENKK